MGLRIGLAVDLASDLAVAVRLTACFLSAEWLFKGSAMQQRRVVILRIIEGALSITHLKMRFKTTFECSQVLALVRLTGVIAVPNLL